MKELKGKYTNAKIFNDNIEDGCTEQIQEMIDSPGFNGKVRIMPDTHVGKASVIGFTMKVKDRIIPNTIGVDIGCGIYAYKIKFDFEITKDNWEDTDAKIRAAVPLGFNRHNHQYKQDDLDSAFTLLENGMARQGKLSSLLSKLGISKGDALNQIGTLGGGNHFVEIAKSKNDGSMWLLIHTGSRNVGKRTCDYWQAKAVASIKCKRKALTEFAITFPEISRQEMIEKVKDSELFKVDDDKCWLEGIDKDEYLQDMYTAQAFAHLNKKNIMWNITKTLGIFVEEAIEPSHNYIDPIDNIIRKGAIRANKGDKVVIPFNMRDGSILAIGKGNEDWNNSAPHGAGRTMSRTQARREVDLDEFRETMKDVFTSSVNSETLDEAPFVYKPMEEIESCMKDTVDIYDRLIPIYNLKDSNFKGKYKRLK